MLKTGDNDQFLEVNKRSQKTFRREMLSDGNCQYISSGEGTYMNCDVSDRTTRINATNAITLVLCTFRSCMSNARGGCLYIAQESNVTVRTCTFISCSGEWGGIGYLYEGTLTMIDSTGEKCYAIEYGGAVRVNGGTAQFEGGCKFTGCYTIEKSGGAIYESVTSNKTPPTLTISGASFFACQSAVDGGAFRAYSGYTQIENTEIQNCQCAGEGGGFCFTNEGNSPVVLSNCTFIKCSAVCGGAVFFDRVGYALHMRIIWCLDCSASNTEIGQAIYINNIAEFKWEHICFTNCGPRPVFSNVNEPLPAYFQNCLVTLPMNLVSIKERRILMIISLFHYRMLL